MTIGTNPVVSDNLDHPTMFRSGLGRVFGCRRLVLMTIQTWSLAIALSFNTHAVRAAGDWTWTAQLVNGQTGDTYYTMAYPSKAQAVAAMKAVGNFVDPFGQRLVLQEQSAPDAMSPGNLRLRYSAPYQPAMIASNWTYEWQSGQLNGVHFPDEESALAAVRTGSCPGVGSSWEVADGDWSPISNSQPGRQVQWQTQARSYVRWHANASDCVPIEGTNLPEDIMWRYHIVSCPAGYLGSQTSDGTTICNNYYTGLVFGSRILECPSTDSGSAIVGDPCDVSTGDFFQTEMDLSAAGLKFSRYYHSATLPSGNNLGVGWTHNYAARLIVSFGVPTGLVRPDGHHDAISNLSGEYVSLSGAAIHVEQSGSNWTARLADGSQEIYDSSGRLLATVTSGGAQTSLSYNANGQLTTVADPFGHTLQFSYLADGHLSQLTDPSGQIITYAYDQQTGNLVSVAYQDGSQRQYVYENSAFPNNLTGIFDENNSRFLTVTYDPTTGAVLTSAQAGGAQGVSIVYAANSAQVTDSLNSVTTYGFTAGGDYAPRVSSVVQGSRNLSLMVPSGDADPQRRVTQRTDPNGNVTTYTYDSDHLTAKTEAYGTGRARTTTYQYQSANSQLPTVVSGPLKKTSYTYYNGTNLVHAMMETDISMASGPSRTWTYTYDSLGRVATIDGPRTDVADTVNYSYYSCTTGSECGQPKSVTDAVGHITTYNSYDTFGLPLTITDPNGIVTTLSYDQRHRLISRSQAGETTLISYWPTGLTKRVTLPDNSYLQYTYDAAHRLTKITDALGNYISYSLDGMGNRTSESSVDASGGLHRLHTRVYNALNQLYQDVNAAGTANVTTTYTYDANGNKTSASAPMGRNTSTQYDELDRVKQVMDAANGISVLGHDANDRVTSVADSRGLSTSYTYDGLGEQLQQGSPDTGTRVDTFDSAGNISTSTDARGVLITRTYDASNRLTSISYAQGGVSDQVISYAYDSGSNGKGRLTNASDANHSLAWSYDALGRVINKTQTVLGVTKTVGYVYTNGHMTTLHTPSGQAVTYGYNASNQISSVAVNGAALLSDVSYEPFGPVNGWTWANGTAVMRSYDADGNVTEVASGGESDGYSYDNAGRLTGDVNAQNSTHSWVYEYDVMDRLTAATSSPWQEAFTFDSNGNRLSQGGSYTSAFTISPTSNRITSTSGYWLGQPGYDAAGNITGFQLGSASATVVHNTAGRISQMIDNQSGISLLFVYNAIGQRVHKSSPFGNTHFVYDEHRHLIGEYDDAGSLIEEMVWLGDIPVATLRPNGSGGVDVYYVHTDRLDTPRKISRPNDNKLVWRGDSDPFENTPPDENPSGLGAFPSHLAFPGQYLDVETFLYENGARYYDPASSRYFESDPIGLNGGLNTYSYVQNNPLWAVDPLGLVTWHGIASTFGGSAFVGAAIYRFSLSTDCVLGKRGRAEVIAVGPSMGLELKGAPPFSTTASGISLNDRLNYVDPNVLSGWFSTWSVGAALGPGYSCSTVLVGGNGREFASPHDSGATSTDCGAEFGVDFGAGGTAGSATVIDQEVTDCDCEKK